MEPNLGFEDSLLSFQQSRFKELSTRFDSAIFNPLKETNLDTDFEHWEVRIVLVK